MAETASTEGLRSVFLPLTPISAQEACQHLGVTPQVLRALCDEYADFVDLHRRDGRTYLDALSFSRLRLVVYWRGKGLTPDEIRARLSEAQGEQAADRVQEDGAGAEQGGVPFSTLEELTRRMDEQERRFREEREKLLTICMRLQQEVNQLRHKVDELYSRRRRRRLL